MRSLWSTSTFELGTLLTFHFKGIGDQRGSITCPRSHSLWEAQPGSEARSCSGKCSHCTNRRPKESNRGDRSGFLSLRGDLWGRKQVGRRLPVWEELRGFLRDSGEGHGDFVGPAQSLRFYFQSCCCQGRWSIPSGAHCPSGCLHSVIYNA